jgi:hypothetical protein
MTRTAKAGADRPPILFLNSEKIYCITKLQDGQINPANDGLRKSVRTVKAPYAYGERPQSRTPHLFIFEINYLPIMFSSEI